MSATTLKNNCFDSIAAAAMLVCASVALCEQADHPIYQISMDELKHLIQNQSTDSTDVWAAFDDKQSEQELVGPPPPPKDPPRPKVIAAGALEELSWPEEMSVQEFLSSGLKSAKKKHQQQKSLVVEAAKLSLTVDQLGKVSANRQHFRLQKVNQILPMQWQGEGAWQEHLRIFVRDQDVLSWDASRGQFQSQRPGNTEIYLFHAESLVIVSIQVGESEQADDQYLAIPKTLVALDAHLFKPTLASFQSSGSNDLERSISAEEDGAEQDERDQRQSLELKRAPLPQSGEGTQVQSDAFAQRAGHQVEYVDVRVQLIDDRSDLAAARRYPVSGSRIDILGTSFWSKSNARGVVKIPGVPKGARLSGFVDHPQGHYRRQFYNFSADGQGIHEIALLRQDIFEWTLQSLGVGFEAAKASLCGQIFDQSQGGRRLAGVQVEIDVRAEGPYYFGTTGLHSKTQASSGSDGRFCFYNVDPGMAYLNLWSGEEHLATVTTALYPDTHRTEDIDVRWHAQAEVAVAVYPSAHEMLSLQSAQQGLMRATDFAEIYHAGRQAPLSFDGTRLNLGQHLSFADETIMELFVQTPEFESAVIQIAADDLAQGRRRSVSLLPRGTIEDLGLYANVVAELDAGHVFVDYLKSQPLRPQQVSFRLISVSQPSNSWDPWLFRDDVQSSGVFFNLQAGEYVLIAETSQGHWLDLKRIHVFDETVSIVVID